MTVISPLMLGPNVCTRLGILCLHVTQRLHSHLLIGWVRWLVVEDAIGDNLMGVGVGLYHDILCGWLTQYLTDSLIDSFIHWFVHSFTHDFSLACSLYLYQLYIPVNQYFSHHIFSTNLLINSQTTGNAWVYKSTRPSISTVLANYSLHWPSFRQGYVIYD